ncbi:hypothetical protein ABVK25_008126 [Lepraria finkii]|uniref:Uncharacterized protein n=1 Tax=Lepraria finkii TaxID=1340010 RepID=A0ABR4B1F0_9LECA
MRNLTDQNMITSLSFGYTAGLNQVVSSLTLGGYDASRFTLSNISVPFAADDSRILTVSVQSITASNTLQRIISPLPTGAFFLIDSSVPDLWLPMFSCQLFEEALG